MDSEERKAFVREHRAAVFGYNRRQHGPSMSVVYYVMDGDDIMVCTMSARSKATAVTRDPHVTLCVLDEQWPLSYLGVYCTAALETDLDATVDLLMRLMAHVSGETLPEAQRPSVVALATQEQRVTLRLTPYATFESPPRTAGDVRATHGLGTTLPWEAPGPPRPPDGGLRGLLA